MYEDSSVRVPWSSVCVWGPEVGKWVVEEAGSFYIKEGPVTLGFEVPRRCRGI